VGDDDRGIDIHRDQRPVRAAARALRKLTQQPVAEAGWRWHILADPDGNEFRVLQPPASLWRDERPAAEADQVYLP
jgi:hypothetical protein